jgi:hypothetical protein
MTAIDPRLRNLILIGIFAIALLIAFPLREAVYEAVIVPAAYAWWMLRLYYHSVNQSIWWFLALFLVLVALSRSLLPLGRLRGRMRIEPRPVLGQVEGLSVWVKRTERGIYFKWLIANRLGKVAHDVLTLRMGGKSRTFFEPLSGPDWAPDEGVEAYLESGLKGSFADYPQGRRFFSRPEPTPLDQDMNEVIEFLEEQVSNHQSGTHL